MNQPCSQMHPTIRHHDTSLPVCLMIVSHDTSLPVCLMIVSHDTSLPVCLTMVHHDLSLLVCLWIVTLRRRPRRAQMRTWTSPQQTHTTQTIRRDPRPSYYYRVVLPPFRLSPASSNIANRYRYHCPLPPSLSRTSRIPRSLVGHSRILALHALRALSSGSWFLVPD